MVIKFKTFPSAWMLQLWIPTGSRALMSHTAVNSKMTSETKSIICSVIIYKNKCDIYITTLSCFSFLLLQICGILPASASKEEHRIFYFSSKTLWSHFFLSSELGSPQRIFFFKALYFNIKKKKNYQILHYFFQFLTLLKKHPCGTYLFNTKIQNIFWEGKQNEKIHTDESNMIWLHSLRPCITWRIWHNVHLIILYLIPIYFSNFEMLLPLTQYFSSLLPQCVELLK